MPDRSAVGQLVQIGVETTEGTGVAANRQLKSIDFNLSGHGESTTFRPIGSKYATQVNPAREWSVAPITGNPTYDEIMYLFAGAIGASVDTTTGTTGQQHVYTPATNAADAIKTYTVQKGGSVRAQSAAGMLITDHTLTSTRAGVALTGNAMAQQLQDGITMTATPTQLPQAPILPTQLSVYIDATRGALGTTKMLRAFSAAYTLGTRFGPVWPLNNALASYGAHVELPVAATGALILEADATGMSYLANFRAGSPVYVRYLWTGPQIGAGPATYSLQIDLAAKFDKIDPFSDQNGVYAITWPFVLIDDGVGAPITVTLVNATAAL